MRTEKQISLTAPRQKQIPINNNTSTGRFRKTCHALTLLFWVFSLNGQTQFIEPPGRVWTNSGISGPFSWSQLTDNAFFDEECGFPPANWSRNGIVNITNSPGFQIILKPDQNNEASLEMPIRLSEPTELLSIFGTTAVSGNRNIPEVEALSVSIQTLEGVPLYTLMNPPRSQRWFSLSVQSFPRDIKLVIAAPRVSVPTTWTISNLLADISPEPGTRYELIGGPNSDSLTNILARTSLHSWHPKTGQLPQLGFWRLKTITGGNEHLSPIQRTDINRLNQTFITSQIEILQSSISNNIVAVSLGGIAVHPNERLRVPFQAKLMAWEADSHQNRPLIASLATGPIQSISIMNPGTNDIDISNWMLKGNFTDVVFPKETRIRKNSFTRFIFNPNGLDNGDDVYLSVLPIRDQFGRFPDIAFSLLNTIRQTVDVLNLAEAFGGDIGWIGKPVRRLGADPVHISRMSHQDTDMSNDWIVHAPAPGKQQMPPGNGRYGQFKEVPGDVTLEYDNDSELLTARFNAEDIHQPVWILVIPQQRLKKPSVLSQAIYPESLSRINISGTVYSSSTNDIFLRIRIPEPFSTGQTAILSIGSSESRIQLPAHQDEINIHIPLPEPTDTSKGLAASISIQGGDRYEFQIGSAKNAARILGVRLPPQLSEHKPETATVALSIPADCNTPVSLWSPSLAIPNQLLIPKGSQEVSFQMSVKDTQAITTHGAVLYALTAGNSVISARCPTILNNNRLQIVGHFNKVTSRYSLSVFEGVSPFYLSGFQYVPDRQSPLVFPGLTNLRPPGTEPAISEIIGGDVRSIVQSAFIEFSHSNDVYIRIPLADYDQTIGSADIFTEVSSYNEISKGVYISTLLKLGDFINPSVEAARSAECTLVNIETGIHSPSTQSMTSSNRAEFRSLVFTPGRYQAEIRLPDGSQYKGNPVRLGQISIPGVPDITRLELSVVPQKFDVNAEYPSAIRVKIANKGPNRASGFQLSATSDFPVRFESGSITKVDGGSQHVWEIDEIPPLASIETVIETATVIVGAQALELRLIPPANLNEHYSWRTNLLLQQVSISSTNQSVRMSGTAASHNAYAPTEGLWLREMDEIALYEIPSLQPRTRLTLPGGSNGAYHLDAPEQRLFSALEGRVVQMDLRDHSMSTVFNAADNNPILGLTTASRAPGTLYWWTRDRIGVSRGGAILAKQFISIGRIDHAVVEPNGRAIYTIGESGVPGQTGLFEFLVDFSKNEISRGRLLSSAAGNYLAANSEGRLLSNQGVAVDSTVGRESIIPGFQRVSSIFVDAMTQNFNSVDYKGALRWYAQDGKPLQYVEDHPHIQASEIGVSLGEHGFYNGDTRGGGWVVRRMHSRELSPPSIFLVRSDNTNRVLRSIIRVSNTNRYGIERAACSVFTSDGVSLNRVNGNQPEWPSKGLMLGHLPAMRDLEVELEFQAPEFGDVEIGLKCGGMGVYDETTSLFKIVGPPLPPSGLTRLANFKGIDQLVTHPDSDIYFVRRGRQFYRGASVDLASNSELTTPVDPIAARLHSNGLLEVSYQSGDDLMISTLDTQSKVRVFNLSSNVLAHAFDSITQDFLISRRSGYFDLVTYRSGSSGLSIRRNPAVHAIHAISPGDFWCISDRINRVHLEAGHIHISGTFGTSGVSSWQMFGQRLFGYPGLVLDKDSFQPYWIHGMSSLGMSYSSANSDILYSHFGQSRQLFRIDLGAGLASKSGLLSSVDPRSGMLGSSVGGGRVLVADTTGVLLASPILDSAKAESKFQLTLPRGNLLKQRMGQHIELQVENNQDDEILDVHIQLAIRGASSGWSGGRNWASDGQTGAYSSLNTSAINGRSKSSFFLHIVPSDGGEIGVGFVLSGATKVGRDLVSSGYLPLRLGPARVDGSIAHTSMSGFWSPRHSKFLVRTGSRPYLFDPLDGGSFALTCPHLILASDESGANGYGFMPWDRATEGRVFRYSFASNALVGAYSVGQHVPFTGEIAALRAVYVIDTNPELLAVTEEGSENVSILANGNKIGIVRVVGSSGEACVARKGIGEYIASFGTRFRVHDGRVLPQQSVSGFTSVRLAGLNGAVFGENGEYIANGSEEVSRRLPVKGEVLIFPERSAFVFIGKTNGAIISSETLEITKTFAVPERQFEYSLPTRWGSRGYHVSGVFSGGELERFSDIIRPSATPEWLAGNNLSLFTRIPFPLLPDQDGDGIPDRDDIDPLAPSFAIDSDGDGESDVFEHLAGTSPRDPGSKLSFSITADGDSHSARLGWNGIGGRVYVIDHADIAGEDVYWRETYSEHLDSDGQRSWKCKSPGLYRLRVSPGVD